MSEDAAILLTATIKPTTKYAKHRNYLARRDEYLKAVKFYSGFGKVIFLENSGYDLYNDKDFMSIRNVKYIQIDNDCDDNHAIGYQEFYMIDKWITSECDVPEKWIKISGRYIIKNFDCIYRYFNDNNYQLLMDIKIYSHWADTFIFGVTSDFYKKNFLGKYKYCTYYMCIESVFYSYLRTISLKKVRFLNISPIYSVISSGTNEKKNCTVLMSFIGNLIRKINYMINKSVIVIENPIKLLINDCRNFIHFMISSYRSEL